MRHFIAMVGLAWPLLATAQAQAPPRIPVDSGDAIRVLMRSGVQLEGSLVRWTADSIGLRRTAADRSADTVVALAEISAVEARVRRHTAGSALKGMGIGLLSGAAAGAVVAGASMSSCQGELCSLAILYIPVVAVAGGVGGLIVGVVRTTEVWEVVWPPDPTPP